MQPAQVERPSSMLEHRAPLSALARCLAREDASDLEQDTWVAALQSRTRPARLGGWLRQVMRNEFRATLRARTRRLAREREASLLVLEDTPTDDIEQRELVAEIFVAIDELPEPYRAVIRTRFLDGTSPTEIATAQRAPPATIRWQIHEGLRRIRETLDRRYGSRRDWHGGALAIGAWPRSGAAKMSTMTRIAMMKWVAGLSLASGGAAIAAVHGSASVAAEPSAALSEMTVHAAAVSPSADSDPDPTQTARWAPRTETSSEPEQDSPPAVAQECAGGCEAPVPPMRGQFGENPAFVAAYEACEHLLPASAKDSRIELEITMLGREGLDNAITKVGVSRGRKLPCVDPDANFDEPDGPDVVYFDAVSACVADALAPDAVEPLDSGEQMAFVLLFNDSDQPAEGKPSQLPAPSSAVKGVDPEAAIAHFNLAPTVRNRAKVSVVECGGYDCSFCNSARDTIAELAHRYGKDLSFYFLQMPLDMHGTGAIAARAALAAGRQGKFWEFHELLFDEPKLRDETALVERARAMGIDGARFQRDLNDPKTAQTVADQRQVCEAAGARGTPSFFINGDLVVGSHPIDAFTAIIDDELAGNAR